MSGIYVEQPDIKQKPVSTERSSNNLWLVKVPKYVADRLRAAECGTNFGMIQTQRTPMGTKFSFDVEPKLCEPLDELPACPSSHEMTLGTLAGPNRSLAAYSDTDDVIDIEGIIKTRFDVYQNQQSSRSYLALKRLEAEKKMEPGRRIIITNKTHNVFKPSNVSRGQLYTTKAEKEEKLKNKRVRLDAESVENMILRAFKKHQYIKQTDLVHITSQPEAYLKEFLNKMCVYNQKNPHKNMWELKPEYRHYENSDTQATTSDD